MGGPCCIASWCDDAGTVRSFNPRPPRSRSTPKPAAAPPARAKAPAAKTTTAAKRPRRGRGQGDSSLSSMPTGRAAYADTRVWLVKQHGLVCAHCAKRESSRHITLDHVAPRRGMTAYDRRDNLVLCCLPCNILKADNRRWRGSWRNARARSTWFALARTSVNCWWRWRTTCPDPKALPWRHDYLIRTIPTPTEPHDTPHFSRLLKK